MKSHITDRIVSGGDMVWVTKPIDNKYAMPRRYAIHICIHIYTIIQPQNYLSFVSSFDTIWNVYLNK